MIAKRFLLRAKVDQATIDLYETVQHLIANTENSREFAASIASADVILESLPFATAEFDLAKRRLENAVRYVASDEPGAAKFELRLLVGSLRPALDQMESLQPESQVLAGPPTGMFKEVTKQSTESTSADLQSA